MKKTFPTLWKEKQKGFITIPVLIIAILGTIVVGGGGYTVYKYKSLQKANIQLIEKVSILTEVDKKEQVDVEPTESLDLFATSTDSNEQVIATTTAQATLPNESKQEPKVIVEQKTVYVPVVVEKVQPPVVVTGEINQEIEDVETVDIVTEPEYLKISDVKKEVNGYVVEVYWKTNKKSDSRLVLGASEFDLGVSKIHVSDNHDSTEHYIKITNLDWSSVYSYQIIAESEGETDTFYDKLATERKFKVEFIDGIEYGDKCVAIHILDTKNVPLEDASIEISGAWFPPSGSPRYLSDTLQDKTDEDGQIVYCDQIDEIKVKNLKTGDVYHNGTFVIK